MQLHHPSRYCCLIRDSSRFRYRDSLFKKLNVSSRVGLVLYAIRNGVVRV